MGYRLVNVIGGRGAPEACFAETLRGVGLGPAGSLYAVGDSEVKVFARDGRFERSWNTERPAYSVAIDPSGTVLVGEVGQVERFDASGRRVGVLRDRERIGRPTALAATESHLFVGDAVHRVIQHYDREGGFVRSIGGDNPTRGFVIPTKYVDFVLDRGETILAANPGKHRVERYDFEGKLLGRIGRFTGPDPKGFTGCCNPTNVAVAPKGLVIVTVKAPPGVKVFDPEGEYRETFGSTVLDPACKTLDLVVDAEGRVFVSDPVRLRICVFTPAGVDERSPAAAGVGGGRDR